MYADRWPCNRQFSVFCDCAVKVNKLTKSIEKERGHLGQKELLRFKKGAAFFAKENPIYNKYVTICSRLGTVISFEMLALT